MDYALLHILYNQLGSIMHSSGENSNISSFDAAAFECVKCVVVGDTSVGKTRLICSYVYDEAGRTISSLCHKHHVPTVFAIDQYSLAERIRAKVSVDGVHAQLRIWDTFGDHAKNRRFAYQNANVVVLCYNIGMGSSLRNVNAKWYPEIKKYCPRAPIILVGTQLDRRHTDAKEFKSYQITTLTDILNNNIAEHKYFADFKCIPPEAGRQTSREINAAAYLEVSIVTKYGVNEVFENAIRAALVTSRLSRPMFNYHLKYVKKPLIQKPFLPDKPKFPQIIGKDDISMSFSEILHDKSSCDVTFLVQNELIHAHCTVLLLGSQTFSLIFMHPKILSGLGYDQLPLQSPGTINLTSALVNGTLTNGIPRGFETIDLLSDPIEKCKVFIKLQNVFAAEFKSIIEFLYTGQLSEVQDLVRLLQASIYLQIDLVSRYVKNLLQGDLSKNAEVQSELEVNRHYQMKYYLHKRALYADVAFLVEQTVIPVHKQILTARCRMMAGMFRHDSFKESASQNVCF